MYYFCTVHYLLSGGVFGPGDVIWIDNSCNVYFADTSHWFGSMFRHDIERFLIPLPIKNESIINNLRALYT